MDINNVRYICNFSFIIFLFRETSAALFLVKYICYRVKNFFYFLPTTENDSKLRKKIDVARVFLSRVGIHST